MSKSFAAEFMETFDQPGLPEEINGRFDVVECLAKTQYGETFLLEEKDGGKFYVLKCFQKSEPAGFSREGEILRGLSYKGLPNYEPEFENDGTIFVLREYLEGMTLEEFLYENKIAETQAADIIIKLCDILYYLHSQPNPIIHRDIKPSNIIIDPRDRSITLIDFGIARKYSENADGDTFHFGTHKFAPPEQYGFSQTDCRADIYALGIVIRYIFTGATDQKIENKALEKIAEKCSAFDPAKRYKNANAVKKSLVRYINNIQQKITFAAASVFLVCLVLFAGFVMGRYTDILRLPGEPDTIGASDETDENIYVFKEPLIEKTARLMLGKDENEPVYRDELLNITEFFLVGDDAVISEKEYSEYRYTGKQPSLSTLKSLEDISAMKNLKTIYIFKEPILQGISPLSENINLESIDIIACNITDLSPLEELPKLDHLFILNNSIKNLLCLQKMRSLRFLGIEWTNIDINSISDLGDIDMLAILSFLGVKQLKNLDGIENLTGLGELNIAYTSIVDFSPLDNLPNIKKLTISKNMEQYLNTLSRDDLEIKICD